MTRIHAALFSAFLLVIAFIPDISSAQNGYAVTERGANYRIVSKSTVEHGTNHVHQYTELATGLNYTNSYGQWAESQEQISIQPNGTAVAVQGQHQVYFPADIYDGVLEVVTPDGKHLKSRPLGVSYDDGSNTVFIATLQHSQGLLTSSNQVTYPDAFTGIKADLVCTYRRNGFECDLVFREQPPIPDQYGLDEASSTLQLVTEFFDTPDPTQIPAANDDWFGLQDSTLKFGKLTMTHGKAFAVKSPNSQLPSVNTLSPVYKTWTHIQGRTFLIEELPLVDLAADLSTLPETTNFQTSKVTSKLRMVSNHRQMPPGHEFVADAKQILIAAADFNQKPGVALDYDEIDSDQSDYTFASGATYYISGEYSLSGTATFEGGTIIKFDGYGQLDLDESGTMVSPSDPSQPAVFTSINDDSVGEIIAGSTGAPSYSDVLTFLNFNCPNPVLHNMRFNHAYRCVSDLNSAQDLEAWDCQFLDVDIAIWDCTTFWSTKSTMMTSYSLIRAVIWSLKM